MASTLSNAYVEKASSEHPLALWMLNEQVDYVSQLTEEERQFQLYATWQLENAEASAEVGTSLNAPFPESAVTRILGDIPPTTEMDIIARSQYLLSDNLVNTLNNFSIGFYSYIDTALANSISFGYQYTDIATSEVIEILHTVPVNKVDRFKWKFVSHTFDLPPDSSIAEDVKLLIKFNVAQGGVDGDYEFVINGLSVGQLSEDFNKFSYGITPDNIPTDIALPSNLKAVSAYPYGASGENAYYLSQGYQLFCKNFGVPLVFGSSNVTKLSPNVYSGVNYPSLIFPGYGFLNERGRHNDYTVEMWIRINSASSEPRRFFGPIVGTDGLYADGAFLTFKLGDSVGSHFVGEWFRPMLVHIRVLHNSAIVVLNGEEVISLDIDQSAEDLASEFDESGRSQDWLGFYAFDDLKPIDIDNFSIYSYGIPTEVTKRRWVWGQAVASPEQTNSSINSITAYNDYAFANYASNYNYPDFANFNQAFYSNVVAGSKSLSLPDYSLPDFEIGSKTRQELFNDTQSITPNPSDVDDVAGIPYLTLKPNSSWNSNSDFIHFKELSVLNDPVESMYGIFKTDGNAVNQPLVKIVSSMSNDYLSIYVNGTTVHYKISISGELTTLATKTIQANKKFSIGLNFQALISSDIADIQRLFTDQSSLSVYLAGDSVSKFTGRIYKFGFDAAYNNRKLASYYDEDGIFSSTEASANTLIDHTANYTLTAINQYGLFFADIAVSGYWEDYMPLSYFSKAVIDYEGNNNYELDSIQFNQDFPEPPASASSEVTGYWTYSDLQIKYSVPTILTYADLDNAFYTKWDNYQDMAQNSVKTNYYNTEDSSLRTYISFQNIADGANTNLIDFANYAKPLTSGILDPSGVNLNWQDTAYEVTTGTVIYPPTKTYNDAPVDFNDLAIVYHLEFKSSGILHHPIRFKELQLASHVLERTDFTPVGSRFGIPVYYYTKSGLYYDLKAKNPITTYKKSTPYLYLNRQSGWKLRGEFNTLTDRGLAIPINLPKAEKTEVSSIQMWVRFAEKEFPEDPIMIFSIEHNNGTYDFFIQGDSGLQRGRVFGVNRESTEVLDFIEYYLNGQSVGTPFLVNEEWVVLGLEFYDLLDFSNNTGRLSLNGPMMYNNVSYNLATNIEKDETLETRTWSDMKSVHIGGITDISTTGTQVTYTSTNTYIAGETVTISEVVPSSFNVTNATVVSATSGTFTIASTVTDTYISGGVVESGKWEDIMTDLVVSDGSVAPFAWQQVKVISQSRTFSIDPKAIYEKYTGSNRIVIDDESSGILVKPERFRLYNEVSWSDNIKIAV